MRGKIGGTGHAAGQDEPLGRRILRLVEQGVGDYRHTMGALHLKRRTYRHRDHGHRCATQDVYHRQGLDFLKALGKKYK